MTVDMSSCKNTLNQLVDHSAHPHVADTKTIHAPNSTSPLHIVTAERDEAVVRSWSRADALEKTRADYVDKIASLTTHATDAEADSGALRTVNNDLNTTLTIAHHVYDSHLESCRAQETNDTRTITRQRAEIVMLTKWLHGPSRQRRALASPLYRFQSFMSR
ncbi:hypothetical protein V8D89_010518 [Ganoderma adspersum]